MLWKLTQSWSISKSCSVNQPVSWSFAHVFWTWLHFSSPSSILSPCLIPLRVMIMTFPAFIAYLDIFALRLLVIAFCVTFIECLSWLSTLRETGLSRYQDERAGLIEVSHYLSVTWTGLISLNRSSWSWHQALWSVQETWFVTDIRLFLTWTELLNSCIDRDHPCQILNIDHSVVCFP